MGIIDQHSNYGPMESSGSGLISTDKQNLTLHYSGKGIKFPSKKEGQNSPWNKNYCFNYVSQVFPNWYFGSSEITEIYY